jgi:hypothetical protein
MGGKGFLAKMGLVESEETDDIPIKTVSEEVTLSPEPTASEPVTNGDIATSVDEFYESKQIDIETGVYQLQAFVATIPASISQVDRVKMVYGILEASKMDIETFIEDAETRTTILQAYVQKVTNDVAQRTEDNTQMIAELQKEIERCQTDIKMSNEMKDGIIKDFGAEIAKINSIVAPFKQT